MQLPAAGEPAVAEAEQGDVEGTLECPFCRFGDRRRRSSGERPLHEPDRPAGEGCKTAGKARVFEPTHGCGEGFQIGSRKIHAVVAERGVSGAQVRR